MKNYAFLLILALLAIGFTANAQVSGMPTGFITVAPTVSTEAAPVWYNMMATNTDAARINRYMYTDGSVLKTDVFTAPDGITEALQHDKYLWRLEQGVSGANYVVFVNKLTGKKLYADAAIGSNGVISVADNGIEWKMAAASAVTTGTVAGQYSFNFESAANVYGLRYLNAGDGVTMAWNVLVFNGAGSPAKSSGWFFYPVTATKTVTFAQPENGSITLTTPNGSLTPSSVASGSAVLVGSVVTLNFTAQPNYYLNALTVNGVDMLSQVVNNSYKLTVNANAVVAAGFGLSTANKTLNADNLVFPNPFVNELTVANKIAGSTMYLYDATGKQIMSTNEASLNTSSVSKGVYMVRYSTENGYKMVKVLKK